MTSSDVAPWLESESFYDHERRRHLHELADAERCGDLVTAAGAQLEIGRIEEKLGRYSLALEHGLRAEAGYDEAGDAQGVAQCHHTIAVWSFHHGHDHRALHSFRRAAAIRESLGTELLAAQTWHNLGYVEARSGLIQDSLASYNRALALLDQCDLATADDLASTAHRNRAFVWSHLAYVHAERGQHATALGHARRYFDLVAETGAHREPLLAMAGVALAYAGDRRLTSSSAAAHLDGVTGIQALPDAWFEAALARGQSAAEDYVPGIGRRPYLGAMLLVLGLSGRWLVAEGRLQEGGARFARAESLAKARGWDGELRRLDAMRQPDQA